MDKLKQVLSPGHSKDDEIMYGTPQQTGASTSSGQESSELPRKLSTDPEAQKKSHSIMRQIMNPGGERYSEQSYGTTAVPAGQAEKPGDLKTEPQVENKETSTGIGRQIFNPGGEKYSEKSYGETATAVPDQGQARDTSQTVPGTTIFHLKADEDRVSCLSFKSGVDSPYAAGADTPHLGSSGQTATAAPTTESTLGRDTAVAGTGTTGLTSTGESTEDSNLGRDVAMAGAGTAGVTYAGATSDEGIRREDQGDDVSGATYTARSYQLGGGQPADPNKPAQVELDNSAPGQTEPTQESTVARDSSLAGAGTLLGGGVAASSVLAAEGEHKDDQEVSDATYTDRAYPVGSTTGTSSDPTKGTYSTLQERVVPTDDSSSRLAPHVPGEFPTETGEDPQRMPGGFPAEPGEEADRAVASGSTIATSMGIVSAAGLGAGAAGYEASKSSAEPTTTESSLHPGGESFPIMTTTNSVRHETPATQTSQESEDHTGRNTAIAGGAVAATGAAGAGTYYATRDEDKVDMGPTTLASQAAPVADTSQESEDHTGRNAAIAGGAVAGTGAAAAGTYYATRDEPATDTGPASKTIGPHESNAANVMDPRVKPEPEKMKQEKTSAGPHKSDMANKADPRVTSDPEKAKDEEAKKREEEANKQEQEEHNYGRDAAVVGGVGAAGAAGYAGYEATKEEEPTTQSSQEASTSDNKTSTDSQGDHYLHKKSAEEKGEKKPSLIQKILHPNKSKQQEKEYQEHQEQVARSSHEQPAGFDQAQQKSRHIGTDGPIGDERQVSGLESSKSGGDGGEVAPTQSKSAAPLPTNDEDGMITLVNEGADPDAHHIVVREHPSG